MNKKVKSNNWLKLKVDFFSSLAMKKIRKIAGGDSYIIIYQKLMLLTVNSEGHYIYQGIEEDIEDELALILDEDPDNIKVAIGILQSLKLLELNNNAIYLNQVPKLIGKYDDSSARVAKYRESQKMLQNNYILKSNEDVTECNALHHALCNEDVTECNAPREEKIREDKDKDKDKKQNNASSDAVFDFSGFSDNEVIAIKEWLQYKQERKESYKLQSGLTKLRNMLMDLKSKGQLVHAIDRSITNGWKGLFEDKNFTEPEDSRTPFCINEKGQPLFFDGSAWLVVSFPVDRLLENETDFRLVKDLRK